MSRLHQVAAITACVAVIGCGGFSLVTIRKGPIPKPAQTPEVEGKPGHCGVERWAIKTLTDPQAAKVSFRAHPVTIAALRRLPAPKLLGSSRIAPTELQAFTVSATLVAWKLEGDLDFHLVLQDEHGATMIAEIPSPTCTQHSRVRAQVLLARSTTQAALGTPSSVRFLTVKRAVQVTGVGFFDFLHGQRGVAPNGIELHPVTQIVFAKGSP